MSTPQRKVWSSWSLTSKSGAQKSGGGSALDSNSNPRNGEIEDVGAVKGKGLDLNEATPLSGALFGENGVKMWSEDAKDRETLVNKVAKLEHEVGGVSLNFITCCLTYVMWFLNKAMK